MKLGGLMSHQFIPDDDGNIDDVGALLRDVFVDIDVNHDVGKCVDR